jgi:uncharacterized protein YndB with AHSA1/START domain
MAEEPLRVERSVVVDCSLEQAFALWTSRLRSWWPLASHSFTKEAAEDVAIEPFAGGRIIERSRDGATRDWGTVIAWDPPRLLRHTWHLGFTPDEATDVTVSFDPEDDGRTRVTVTQTGFERLGDQAGSRRDGNERGWDSVIPSFVSAVMEGRAESR